jgi:hypothetical protein
MLDDSGLAADVNNPKITWIRLNDKKDKTEQGQKKIEQLSERQRQIVRKLQNRTENEDNIIANNW